MPPVLHMFVGLIIALSVSFTNILGKTQTFPDSDSVMKWKNNQRTDDQALFQRLLSGEVTPRLPSQRPRSNRADAKRNALITDKKAVDDFVDVVMSCRDVPGLSIAVVKDGRSWTKGFGVKDVVKKTPVDASTLFGIGSLTKAFTSALLAVALEEANLLGKK